MIGLQDDECQRLLQILREIIKDKDEFEQMIGKTLQLQHNIPEITTTEDIYDYSEEITAMLQHYTTLLSLLVDLRRRGRISFHGEKQTTTFLNLYLIIKELGTKLEKLKPLITEGHSAAIYTLSRQFEHNLNIFLKAEHRDIPEIEKELGMGISLSQEKILEVKEGKFRVEIHRGVVIELFADGYRGKRPYPYGLQIFDYDYLVGEAGLIEFIPKGKIIVVLTQVYLRKKGYMQRTIDILLRQRVISEWCSDISLSREADAMYERMKTDSRFNVTFNKNRYIVKIKE